MSFQHKIDSEELQLILSTSKRFAERRLDENTLLEFDHKNHCPEDLIREMFSPDVGLHLTFLPSAYGGLGCSTKDLFQICEYFASLELGIATSMFSTHLGIEPLLVGGTEEQKQHWITKVAKKGLIAAFAVTEPSAGSDLAAILCKAKPVIEHGRTIAYILNGNKQFITNGSIADIYTVLAMSPRGPCFFVVEKGTRGFEPGLPEVKHGIHASNNAPIALDDVRVPVENLVGRVEGKGLAQAIEVLDGARVMVASFGLGCGNAALRRAWAYGQERKQGGSLLCNHTGWTYKLIIPHVVALEASRAYIEQLVHRLDTETTDLQVEGAIAKLIATESANAAAEAAIQAHGGYGYMHGYHVEKLKRDVRITCIYEGTSEIMQQTIASERLRTYLQSYGKHYYNKAQKLEQIEQKIAGCGAHIVALCYNALTEIFKTYWQVHLNRNQHLQFKLGALIAYAEVADAFACKVALGNPDTSRFPIESLRAMSRVYTRRASLSIVREGLEIVAGSDVLSGKNLRGFKERIKEDEIHDGLFGQLADFAEITQSMHNY